MMPACRSGRLFRLIHRFAPRAAAGYVVLYLLTLAGAPIADARLEAAATNIGRHVEAEQAAACPVHDHQACQLCRTLRTLHLPATPVLTAPLGEPVVASASAVRAAPAARWLHRSRLPRAPPLLS